MSALNIHDLNLDLDDIAQALEDGGKTSTVSSELGSDIAKTTPPSSSMSEYDMETIAGKLPTRGTTTESKGLLTKLAQFHQHPSSATSDSLSAQRDGILKLWAVLLHRYFVAETVAFAVVEAGSKQLACSHWPVSDSEASAFSLEPRLTLTPFETSKYHSQVNTAVTFADLADGEGGIFDYVLHTSKAGDTLSLYTRPTCVPFKFASAVWENLVETRSELRTSPPHTWRNKSISDKDKQRLRLFLPRAPSETRLSMHDLWRESVRTAPMAPAVDAWDGRLTYEELDELAESVAHLLLAKGVRTGDFVPFSFEKSVWMVVAMLGIVKAGAALVAIDPTQPRARAREIIDQIQAKVILASPSQVASFVDMGLVVLPVSSSSFKNNENGKNTILTSQSQLPPIKPEEPAVCIFTSGSTGKPKGIVVQHSALVTRMLAEGGALGFRGARCLQFAASTWDIFLTEVFATLAHNGCVCVPSEEDRLFNLAEFCTKYNVRHAIVTPSLANTLTPASFPTLRTLVFSGEALRADVVARWSSSQTNISLYQGYGPAETGGCIIGRLAGNRAETLGLALKDYMCVLVDPDNHDRLVPVGVVGELLVAGPGLLKEYLGNPAGTAAAVVQRPSWCSELGIEQTTRFYKTGDLLRYNIDTLDGSFDFVGRADGQVKFHGQRIELGEIEHHLALFPNVTHAMATLVKEGGHHLSGQLVAVVQFRDASTKHHATSKLALLEDAELVGEQIRKFLSARLPSYMVPSRLFVVSGMPFNASMKLDRPAITKWISNLTMKDTTTAARIANQTRPRSPGPTASTKLFPDEKTALAIARIYAGLVGGNEASLRRRFEGQDFKLQSGGIDSIQIMSLAMALKQEFGIEKIPMTQMLSSKSTVRSLAAMIDAANGNHHQQQLQQSERDEPSALLHSKLIGNKAEDDDDIDALVQSVISSPKKRHHHHPSVQHVFLTGASGYLGIEILRQLLTQSDCQIYALVRGTSEDAARDYLVEKAVAATWWNAAYLSRIHIWPGDLSQPRLGLGPAQWQSLQGDGPHAIDAIIHNGARVHYHADYESLKAANVSSTIELLKAVNGREKPLHSFVYVSGGQALSFDDEDDTTQHLHNKPVQGFISGYARSKAVSELIVRKYAQLATRKAKHVRVVKPGFIIGDAERGVASKDDFIWRYLAASVGMGIYDEVRATGWLFLADISRVSEVILQSTFGDHDTHDRLSSSSSGVVKILDGIQFRDIWVLLKDLLLLDDDIRPVSPQEWLSKLRQTVAITQEKHVMFPLMHMFETDAQLPALGVPHGPSEPSPGVREALQANIRTLAESGFFSVRPPDDSTSAPSQTPPPLSGSLATTPAAAILEDNNNSTATPIIQDAFEVESVRRKFPALQEDVIGFNNAAGTAVYEGAIEGTRRYMSAPPIEVGLDDARSKKKTEGLMSKIKELAAFMNADPDEIAIGQSTTMLLRILGQALRPSLNSDCELVISNLCHEASAAAWIALAKDLGVAIKWWAPPATQGDDPCLSPDTLKPLLTPKTRIVACNHVSNVVGTIHPIRAIADLVHAIPGAILIVDGVAWAPHRPIDVRALDVDFYCFSWYKVFGPHIAQLYGRRETQRRLISTGISHFFLAEYGGLDWRLRLGSPAFELEAALVPITRYLREEVGWERIVAQETALNETLLAYLRRHPSVFRIFGDKSASPERRVAVITFQVRGRNSRDVMNAINRGTRFRIVAGHCWAPRPTHDVLRLREDGLIRVSFVHYNTVAEVREFCEALHAVVMGSTE